MPTTPEIMRERTAAEYREDANYWRKRHNNAAADALDARAAELEFIQAETRVAADGSASIWL